MNIFKSAIFVGIFVAIYFFPIGAEELPAHSHESNYNLFLNNNIAKNEQEIPIYTVFLLKNTKLNRQELFLVYIPANGERHLKFDFFTYQIQSFTWRLGGSYLRFEAKIPETLLNDYQLSINFISDNTLNINGRMIEGIYQPTAYLTKDIPINKTYQSKGDLTQFIDTKEEAPYADKLEKARSETKPDWGRTE